MTDFVRSTFHGLALAALTLLGPAHASDIDCATLPEHAAATEARRRICESALFSMGDQRIHAEQQRLLKAGAISEADIAAFRNKRDSCNSASCLDAVFRQWRQGRHPARQ